MPKYKSKFEESIAIALRSNKLPIHYEAQKFEYQTSHTYTPDWKVNDSLYIESKGLWDAKDRTKHKLVRANNPEVKFIMCFQNPNLKLSKKSKTTYAQYCDKQGWKWCTIENLVEAINNDNKTY
jgi:hypothetical protein